MNRDDWIDQAACRDMDHAVFFPTGIAQFQVDARERKVAREVCGPCPVRLQCLMDACQDSPEDDVAGVRGGMTAAERVDFRVRNEIQPTRSKLVIRGSSQELG